MDAPTWLPVAVYASLVVTYLAAYSWANMDDSIGRQPFVMLLFLTLFLLGSDLYGRLEGAEGISVVTLQGATVINFILLPAVGVEWHQFVRNVLSAEERLRMRTVSYLCSLAAGVGVIASMFSPITSWVFYYDSAGFYHRGDLFPVPALTTFFIFIVTDLFLLTQVRSLERYSIRMLGAYPIPVVLSSLLTFVIADVPWMPLGFSVASLALFAHMQNTGMGRDYLTGVYNRKKLEMLMAERIARVPAGYRFAGIMMDIDRFKLINDMLGHTVGDLALADAARLLQRSVRSGDAVARFGGDEFFILLDIDNEGDLQEIVSRIDAEEKKFALEGKRYELHFSKGYDIYDPQRFASTDAFEKHLDELMYADKERHHRMLEDQKAASGVETVINRSMLGV